MLVILQKPKILLKVQKFEQNYWCSSFYQTIQNAGPLQILGKIGLWMQFKLRDEEDINWVVSRKKSISYPCLPKSCLS